MSFKKFTILFGPIVALMCWLAFKKTITRQSTPAPTPPALLDAACVMECCSSIYQLSSGDDFINIAAARCTAHDNFKRFVCSEIECTLHHANTTTKLTAPSAVFDEPAQQLTLPELFTLQRDDLTAHGSAAVLDLKTLELSSSQPIKIENAQVMHAAHGYTIDLKNKTTSFDGGVTTVLRKG